MAECLSVREMGPRTLRDSELARTLQKQLNEELQKQDENMARQIQEMENSPRATAGRMSRDAARRDIQDTTPESSSDQSGEWRPPDSSSHLRVGRRLEFDSPRSNRRNIPQRNQPIGLHTASRGDTEDRRNRDEMENSPRTTAGRINSDATRGYIQDTTPESSSNQSGDWRPPDNSSRLRVGRRLEFDSPRSNRRNIPPRNQPVGLHTASRGDTEDRRNRDENREMDRPGPSVGRLAAMFERRISESGGDAPRPFIFGRRQVPQPGSGQADDAMDLDDYEANWELEERIGVVKTNGMSKKDIDRLPVYQYTGPSASSDTDGETCVICACSYELTDTLRTLPCFHRYHLECVDNWLTTKAECPVCRKSTKLKKSNIK